MDIHKARNCEPPCKPPLHIDLSPPRSDGILMLLLHLACSVVKFAAKMILVWNTRGNVNTYAFAHILYI